MHLFDLYWCYQAIERYKNERLSVLDWFKSPYANQATFKVGRILLTWIVDTVFLAPKSKPLELITCSLLITLLCHFK